ncbi:MAG: radical SAM family heme chaperone HemW [Pseudomonadota bacterium]
MDSPGLYIHVPFCRTKCPYCDFYSVTSTGRISAWLDALEKEAILYKDDFDPFDSLYLGGGTPSLLGQAELTRLAGGLFRTLAFSPDTEFTIEANPDDIDADKPAVMRDLGINRFSLGAQSFSEKDLLYLKRRHSVGQTEKALRSIRRAGFKNIGIDLIYGFEGQTEKRWMETMARVLEFEPEHISCYQMTFEPGTPFTRMNENGRIKPLGASRERAFSVLTSRFLTEHGYIHYEISNYARSEEFRSRHNQKYWNHTPYLGLGPAAHSFRNGERWWNPRSVTRYCEAVRNGRSPVEAREVLSQEQLRMETVFLGFRTLRGVDLKDLGQDAGVPAILSRLKASKLIKVEGERIYPTLKGFLIADSLPLLFA